MVKVLNLLAIFCATSIFGMNPVHPIKNKMTVELMHNADAGDGLSQLEILALAQKLSSNPNKEIEIWNYFQELVAIPTKQGSFSQGLIAFTIAEAWSKQLASLENEGLASAWLDCAVNNGNFQALLKKGSSKVSHISKADNQEAIFLLNQAFGAYQKMSFFLRERLKPEQSMLYFAYGMALINNGEFENGLFQVELSAASKYAPAVAFLKQHRAQIESKITQGKNISGGASLKDLMAQTALDRLVSASTMSNDMEAKILRNFLLLPEINVKIDDISLLLRIHEEVVTDDVINGDAVAIAQRIFGRKKGWSKEQRDDFVDAIKDVMPTKKNSKKTKKTILSPEKQKLYNEYNGYKIAVERCVDALQIDLADYIDIISYIKNSCALKRFTQEEKLRKKRTAKSQKLKIKESSYSNDDDKIEEILPVHSEPNLITFDAQGKMLNFVPGPEICDIDHSDKSAVIKLQKIEAPQIPVKKAKKIIRRKEKVIQAAILYPSPIPLVSEAKSGFESAASFWKRKNREVFKIKRIPYRFSSKHQKNQQPVEKSRRVISQFDTIPHEERLVRILNIEECEEYPDAIYSPLVVPLVIETTYPEVGSYFINEEEDLDNESFVIPFDPSMAYIVFQIFNGHVVARVLYDVETVQYEELSKIVNKHNDLWEEVVSLRNFVNESYPLASKLFADISFETPANDKKGALRGLHWYLAINPYIVPEYVPGTDIYSVYFPLSKRQNITALVIKNTYHARSIKIFHEGGKRLSAKIEEIKAQNRILEDEKHRLLRLVLVKRPRSHSAAPVLHEDNKVLKAKPRARSKSIYL